MKRREFLQSGLLLGAASMGLIPTNELAASEIVPVVDVPVAEIDWYNWKLSCEYARYGLLDELKRMVERYPTLIHYYSKKYRRSVPPAPTLCHAATAGYGRAKDVRTLEFIITRGANINLRDRCGQTPLHRAINCPFEFLECLVGAGAEINVMDDFGSSPLHVAASGIAEPNEYLNADDYKRAFDFLVAQGADIHAKNHSGKTPLDILKAGKTQDWIL